MLFGRHVNKFYLRYFLNFFFGILFLLFVDLIQLQVPEIVGNLTADYDAGILTKETINKEALIIVFIAFGMFFGRFIWRICILNGAFHIAADLREEMFDHSLELSSRFYRNNKVGGIMSFYTNDVDTIQESYGWGTVMFIDATFLSVLTFYKMANTNWRLTLICAVPLLVLCVVSYFIDQKMEKIYGERQDAFEKMSDYAQELFTGLRVIKAFVREVIEAKRFKEVNENHRQKDLNLVKFSAFLDTAISILIQGMFVIGMSVGGYFIVASFQGNEALALTRDEMMEFIMYFDTIIWPMMALGQIVSLLSRAKTSLKRVTKYLEEPKDVQDKKDAISIKDIKGEITFNNFSYSYDGKIDILKDISLTIHAGENIGIIGKIGSGKSSLVQCLLRMDNVKEGQIFIDGIDMMNLKIKDLREAIAYVPQDNFLFSTTVQANISFSDDALSEQQIIEAAEFADVHDNIVDFVEGYRTLVGERGVTLSGGQKQRISIARAFVKHAPIMIMDDSVSAVDVKTEEKILKNIREKRKGQTTILIASRASTVQHLDRVIVLNEGRLEAFDTPERLINISPTYAKMIHLQTLEKEMEES